MIETLNEVCGNCKFFRDNECRRFPPQLTLWATDNQHPIHYATGSSYPDVNPSTSCCGEFDYIAVVTT